MIGIDTNVLLRFLVHDDPEQGEKARQFMTERTAEDPAYVSAVVLAEVIWFLRQRLNYSKAQIVDMLRLLIASSEIVIEHTEELELLLAGSTFPAGDVADYLVAWSAGKVGCRKVITFDRKAAQAVPGMELLA
jgi:predicted nucleic-acid-binding protein